MTPDTAAIRARAEKATPGPWDASEDTLNMWNEQPRIHSVGVNKKLVTVVGNAEPQLAAGEEWDANAVFIAAARTDVPALCDEIDRLRAELAAKDDAVRAYINAMAAELVRARANVWEEAAKIAMEKHEFDETQKVGLGSIYMEAYQDACMDIAAALSAAAQKASSSE